MFKTDFILLDDEHKNGIRYSAKTKLSDIKDHLQIKGRLYIKQKFNCGGRVYKLANSSYSFSVFPV